MYPSLGTVSYPASLGYAVSSFGDTRDKAEQNAGRLFHRLIVSAFAANLLARLTGRSNRLLELASIVTRRRMRSQRYLGLKTVDIEAIRGSEGRCNDFDAAFRPLISDDRQRWVGVATAAALEVALPPVELIQIEDTYFVRDGHHRISVAQARGQHFIDAIVTVWQLG